MSQIINVIKSDGSSESLDINKIVRWATWATNNCPDVSLENLITAIDASFYDGMSTNDITIALCKSCEDSSVIAAQQKQYKLVRQYFDIARNLYIPCLIKKVNKFHASNLTQADEYSSEFVIDEANKVPLKRYKIKSILQLGINIGSYDAELLDGTIPDELFDYMDSILDYSKMNLLYFNGLRQLEAKYLTSYNNNLIEDPQQHFMLIALTITHSDAKVYSRGKDIEFLKETILNYYLQKSEARDNSPTPFSVGLRTPHKQYDSCFTKDTPVNTSLGVVSIQDLTSDHLIITDVGAYSKVNTVTSKPYTGKLYSIRTTLSPEVKWYSTEDHKFRVKESVNTSNIVWKEAKDITSTDYLYMPYNTNYDLDTMGLQIRLSNSVLITSDYSRLEVFKQYFISSRAQIKVESTEEATTDFTSNDKPRYKLSLVHSTEEFSLLFYEKGVFVPVTGINTKDTTDEVVYDINVEGDNPSFTVEGYAVHNCLLFEIGDDNNSIDVGMMVAHKATVAGAGVGVSVGAIRAKGKLFRQSHVHNGLLGYLGQLTKTIKGSSQQTRGGSATVNMSVWHRDFYELVMLKDVTSGIEGENRYRDLDYCFHFSQYIISKLPTNGKILLASPNELTSSGKTLYEAFYNVDENGMYDDSEYIQYCEEKLSDPNLPYINANNTQTVKAGELCYTTAYDLFSTLASQMMSVGRLYTLNVTHVNNHSCYLDAIRMTNLCVAPETLLLTDKGNLPISSLDGQEVNVWNGSEWSSVVVNKTGTNQKLLKVSTNTDKFVECTEYHKFYVLSNGVVVEKRAFELDVNDYLIPWEYEDGSTNLDQITSIEDLGRFDDTYCVNEPERHMVVFNNMLLGQCVEITQPTNAVYLTYNSKENTYNPSPESEASFCQLGGFVFGNNTKEDIQKTCYWIIRSQEAVFNISEYSKIPFSNKQKKRRNIGIGLVNTQRMLVEEVYSKFPQHKWVKETARVMHEYMESIQYYLLRASCDLAKELGPCEYFDKTKYSKGILPIDTYTKTELNDFPLLQDWESLRSDILLYGLRFSSHTAFMPKRYGHVKLC